MIDTRITVDGKEVGAYDQRTIEQRVTKNEQALQARADWNQNDSTAADYVKNRTHYTKMVTVLEYGVLGGFEDDGSGIYICSIPYTLGIYEGLKVEVTWDNQVYQLTATQLSEGVTFIGNKIFLGGEDSGEPFFIVTNNIEGETGVGSTGTETSHKVGIVVEQPVRIKPYFLPSNIVYLQDRGIPINLVIPFESDIFGCSIIGSERKKSTLTNPYPNKVVLIGLTLEHFNAMLDGTVYLPRNVLIGSNIASVTKQVNRRRIRVWWSDCSTYEQAHYGVAGASITLFEANIHEEAGNSGTIVSEYAVITVADKQLT